MDYMEMSKQFVEKASMLHKIVAHQKIIEATRGEAYIFQYIAKHDGDVIPGQISSEMNISSARIAAILNSLENKGLITRHIDRDDRRRTIIRLTPSGEAESKKYMRALLESVAKMLERLGEDDSREYIRIISRLVTMDRRHDT